MHRKAIKWVFSEIPLNTKIVSIRWDVVPWSLVLDLDVPENDSSKKHHRGVILFRDVGDITLPLNCARLPHGCFIDGPITVDEAGNGFSNYSLKALMPEFEGNSLEEFIHDPIVIRAQSMECLISEQGVNNPDNMLERAEREQLCSIDDFVEIWTEEGKSSFISG